MMVKLEGPLARWADGLAQELARQGYTERTVVRMMAMTGRLSQHLQRRGVGVEDLSAAVIDESLSVLRVQGGVWGERPRSVPWLVDYLTAMGAIPTAEPALPWWRGEELVERFRTYLLEERGVTEDTVEIYVRAAVLPFLEEHRGRDLDELTVADVTRFVTNRCRTLSYGWASHCVSGLRSFFGFALVEGLTEQPLASAVPSVARWSDAALPRFLSHGQVTAMLKTCDRRRAIGRRNYAILVLLVRLGLRSAEVAGLRLDDIDWRAGEVVVRGKGGVEERLPLPADVGEAIASYLRRGRPRRPDREVFLRAVAPLCGLSPGGVAEVARTASERAGVGSFGPHRLRHTCATEMLRAGAPLAEVAQVLRHRSIAVSAGYAKVDHRALRELAMAWPGSGE
jgi:site-specific recombinase XerD